jgi:hypothetical protein
VSRKLTISRRVATASRWPLGVLITGWNYLWRTTPWHRSELPGRIPDDLPPPLPAGVDRRDVQAVDDGVGPLMHRTYVILLRDAKLTAHELIDTFARRPNRAAPTELARFVKLRGDANRLAVNDEFTIRMPGPWDGPVRVIDVGAREFSFATLDGHLEAGLIRFAAQDVPPASLELRIESWARSGDRLSNVLFDRLRVSKEVQLHMWTSVLERLARESGGRRAAPVDIVTRRVDPAQLDER